MAQFRRHVSRGVAASSLLLLLTTAAQGAIYSGRFDPTGDGANFPGFNGEGIFNIADDCVNQGNGYHFTQNFGDSSGCGDSYMTSAAVNLYDPSQAEPLNNPVDHFSLSGSFGVIGVLVEGGTLVGVDTQIIGPATNDAGYAPNGDPPDWYPATPFWLQFQSGFLCENNIQAPCVDPVYIYMGSTQNPSTQIQSKPATDVTFQTVPEPGTLSLLLSALGLGWFVRRRAKA